MLLRGARTASATPTIPTMSCSISSAGGEGRHRRVPRLRLPELGREHARRDGRGGRQPASLRGRDLLHRRHPRSRPREIRPQILCGLAKELEKAGAHISASRTWRGC
jgi:hypothetical protein